MKRLIRILLCAAVAVLCASCSGTTTPEETSVSAPTGLKLYKATQTSLTFQWTAVDGASSYKWAISQGGSAVDGSSVTTRNVKVGGLTAGTTYLFSVRAVASDGTTSEAAELEATTESSSSSGTDDSGEDLTSYYEEFDIPSWEDDAVERAFPGAEGGGMYATGGRGGTVYHVTNLNDRGEGSLRYGLETLTGARTIIFDVAGTIELESKLSVKQGNVTIAGQSAPGDGICLKNYTFAIAASNVIVRFIRCRMGDEKKTEDDAIQIMSHTDDVYSNIIIDHCSVSWCTDECASFYGMKDFTFQWNFVTESLRASIHDKGNHGYGGIWGGTDAAYHHNLLAHHDSRNPRIDHDYVSTQKGPLTIANNVVYNWSGNTCYGGESSSKNGSDYRKYNFIGNYYKPGPATPSNHIWLLDPTTSCSNCGGTIIPGHFYMTGNYMYGKSAMTSDNWSALSSNGSKVASTIKSTELFSYAANPSYLSLQGAEDAFTSVLGYAGASHVRDAIDSRIASETKNGTYTYKGSNGSTGGLIDTQTDVADDSWVNGWPVYTFSSDDEKLKDADADGMPNWFEEQFGLSKSDPSDAAKVSIDKNGHYTNLEMYLHYIVKDIITAENTNATYTNL